MKVYIKNKVISLGGSTEVLNEQQQPLYEVKGKIISPTKKKLMYDMNGNLLYTIRNKYWTFFCRKVLIFDAEKNRVATIKKGSWSLSRKYQILDCVDTMEIQGRFFSGTSEIMRNGEVAGVITRNFSLIKDAFTLEADEKDIPFLTALVVGLDNIIDQARDND